MHFSTVFKQSTWRKLAYHHRQIRIARLQPQQKDAVKVPHERAAIVKENVGVVFLTNGQESPAGMLKLLLNKWDLLNFLDDHEPRPFASLLSPNGRLTTRFREFQL